MQPEPLTLTYDGGTVVITGGTEDLHANLPGVRYDPRTDSGRAEGRCYRSIVEHLRANKIAYQDYARVWQETRWDLKSDRTPYPHQTEAVDTWWKRRGQGVVVLPTG